jgi:hypothetical protein
LPGREPRVRSRGYVAGLVAGVSCSPTAHLVGDGGDQQG